MSVNHRYCMALDLKDDPELIEEYKNYHAPGNVWPEIIDSINDSGIKDMEIYIVGNRLFMIMDVNESFDFDKKTLVDAANDKTQEWEALMWKYQLPLKWGKPGEKWVMMEMIFKLPEGTV
ncbi:MAG: L-rhamnose mutarotase [Gammaproteobacteria bacterium]|nr:L-rhamnose mutarotase [Gammaproteobacteria bacterium]